MTPQKSNDEFEGCFPSSPVILCGQSISINRGLYLQFKFCNGIHQRLLPVGSVVCLGLALPSVHNFGESSREILSRGETVTGAVNLTRPVPFR
jgi:hypothetical protein